MICLSPHKVPVFQAVKGCSRRYPLGWAVFSSTVGPAFGGLAGTYVGASGEATLGVGAGANVLIGGSARSVTLQPLSLQGGVGLNVQLGVSGLELVALP